MSLCSGYSRSVNADLSNDSRTARLRTPPPAHLPAALIGRIVLPQRQSPHKSRQLTLAASRVDERVRKAGGTLPPMSRPRQTAGRFEGKSAKVAHVRGAVASELAGPTAGRRTDRRAAGFSLRGSARAEALGSPLAALAEMRGRCQRLRDLYRESTRALVAAVEARDPHCRAHSVTVARYALAIARRMKFSDRDQQTLEAAALLHDIGKIGIPDAILAKPASLTPEEFAFVKRHPQIAVEILGRSRLFTDERQLILYHHERIDGRGYPEGLSGCRIPIGARVLAVADAVEAMLSPRTYKPAFDVRRVRAELQAGAGRQFDENVVEVALKWLDDPAESAKAGTGPLLATAEF